MSKELVVFALLFLPDFTFQAETQCIECADITFLLDESTSVNNAEFDLQHQFIISIVNQFSVFGPTGIQISVALFATNARNAFYLNQYTTKSEIIAAVNSIVESTGNSGIGNGMKFVREYNFAPENGANRENCRKILITVADGAKNTGADIFQEAVKLKAMGVTIIPIGVGSSSLLSSELILISSRNDLVLDLQTFDNLNAQNNIEHVVGKICEIHPRQCATCADIVILLDESNSVDDREFIQFKDFIFNLMNSFSTYGQPLGVQFGMSCFATGARNHFFLNSYNNKVDTIDGLLNINRAFGNTATGEGLKFVRQTQFTEEHGSNRTCPKILIVLLDGQQNSGSATIQEQAQLLRDMGVVNFAVGVVGASTTELEQIASTSPDNSLQYVYNLATFDDLRLNIGSIAEQVCNVAGPPPNRHRCKHHQKRR